MLKKKVPKYGAKKTTAKEVSELKGRIGIKDEIKKETIKTGKKGRPSVMSDSTINRLNEAFGWGCSNPEAALHAGISLSTLEKYLYANPEYKEHIDQLKETPTLVARGTLVKSLKDSPYYAFKYLERKKSDEFSLKIKQTFEEPEPLSQEEEDEINEAFNDNL